jgi:hypothetical protein
MIPLYGRIYVRSDRFISKVENIKSTMEGVRVSGWIDG